MPWSGSAPIELGGWSLLASATFRKADGEYRLMVSIGLVYCLSGLSASAYRWTGSA